MRANAAETLVPLVPVSERWQLSEDERASAEAAERASYQVTPEHWGARLCLMSAHESLHAALRIAASSGAHEQPEAAAWRDAAQRAAESARLALEAESALKDSAAAAEQASASAAADARAAEDAADAAQAKPADNLGDLDDMDDD